MTWQLLSASSAAAAAAAVIQRMLKPRSLEPHRQVKITFCSESGASPPSAKHTSEPNQSKTQHSSANDDYNGNGYNSHKVRTVTADLLMLVAGNSRQMGRRVNVCPDAVLDDGLLDFTLLTGQSLTGEVISKITTMIVPWRLVLSYHTNTVLQGAVGLCVLCAGPHDVHMYRMQMTVICNVHNCITSITFINVITITSYTTTCMLVAAAGCWSVEHPGLWRF